MSETTPGVEQSQMDILDSSLSVLKPSDKRRQLKIAKIDG